MALTGLEQMTIEGITFSDGSEKRSNWLSMGSKSKVESTKISYPLGFKEKKKKKPNQLSYPLWFNKKKLISTFIVFIFLLFYLLFFDSDPELIL